MMYKIATRYGLIAGISVACYVFMLDAFDLVYSTQWGAWLGYLSIVIMPVATWLALRAVQKQLPGRQLPFGYALLTGMLLSLVAALCFSVMNYAYTHWIKPDYVSQMVQRAENWMREQGSSTEEVLKAGERTRAHYSSAKPYINTLLWYMGLGLVYTSVSYLVIWIKQKRI